MEFKEYTSFYLGEIRDCLAEISRNDKVHMI